MSTGSNPRRPLGPDIGYSRSAGVAVRLIMDARPARNDRSGLIRALTEGSIECSVSTDPGLSSTAHAP
jgi:hypothetical protein